MEIRYALIKSGQVENVILADAEFIATIAHQYDHCELLDTPEEQQVAGVGWTWDGTQFTAPPALPAPPVPRHISVGSFFDRFGAHKYPILAIADAGVQALIKDCSVRKYIDLDNQALLYGLQMLVAAGFAIDPDAVINAPIADGERA